MDALTQSKYYDGYALSPHQGYVLKQLIDVLNSSGAIGSAMVFKTTESNIVYGCYSTGIYTITGSETGIPLTGYPGYMLTLRYSDYHILKVLFLVNCYCYVIGQNNDGSVASNWKRLSIISE